METAANWVAPIATTLAAVMVAANLGTRITGWGFIVFSIGSIGWIVIGAVTGQGNLLWQNVFLLVVNLVGVWRWLGIRARYEKGAGAATEATAQIFRRRR
jgi:hypothetical protein